MLQAWPAGTMSQTRAHSDAEDVGLLALHPRKLLHDVAGDLVRVRDRAVRIELALLPLLQHDAIRRHMRDESEEVVIDGVCGRHTC